MEEFFIPAASGSFFTVLLVVLLVSVISERTATALCPNEDTLNE